MSTDQALSFNKEGFGHLEFTYLKRKLELEIVQKVGWERKWKQKVMLKVRRKWELQRKLKWRGYVGALVKDGTMEVTLPIRDPRWA